MELPSTWRLVQNEVMVIPLADDHELLVGALPQTITDPLEPS